VREEWKTEYAGGKVRIVEKNDNKLLEMLRNDEDKGGTKLRSV
jgi:hypothetical protein